MDQGPELSSQSGLERDTRQDEAPTRYLGTQDEFPTACDNSGQDLNYVDSLVKPQAVQDLPSHMPINETRSHVCGLRVSTFLLLAMVIVLLGLAGVGMGVLGSRITSERNNSAEQNRCVRWSGIHKQGPCIYYSIRVSWIRVEIAYQDISF